MATFARSSSTGAGRTGNRPASVLVAVATAVVLVFGAGACVGEPPEVTVDDPELQLGRDLYRSNCAACHGSSGAGGSGPALAEGAAVAAYPRIEAQIELVADGRGRMPAYGQRFDADQLRAVVRYTREVL